MPAKRKPAPKRKPVAKAKAQPKPQPKPLPKARSKPKARAKAKPRKPVNVPALIWGLAAANTIAGLLMSPAVHVQSVRVIGAAQGDQDAITQFAQPLREESYFLGDTNAFETQLRTLPRVKDAEVSRNLFGRMVVNLSAAGVVAEVGEGYALTESGRLVAAELPGGVGPRIVTDSPAVNPGLLSSLTLDSLSELAQQVALHWPGEDWEIKVTSDGTRLMALASQFEIQFGALSHNEENEDVGDSAEKWKAIDRIIGENPDLTNSPVVLNVVAPAWPTLKDKSGVEIKP